MELYESLAPATEIGIEKYLGSGLIKGIGPEMAKRIVRRFGLKTLELIDKKPGHLSQVEGIGPKENYPNQEGLGRAAGSPTDHDFFAGTRDYHRAGLQDL